MSNAARRAAANKRESAEDTQSFLQFNYVYT